MEVQNLSELERQQLERQQARLEEELQRRYCHFGKVLLELAETELRQTGRIVDELVEIKRALYEREQPQSEEE